jgi:amino-acid N-acetyltransferase
MEYHAEGAQPPDLAGALDLLTRSDLPVTGVIEHFRNFLVVRADVTVVGVAGLEPCGDDGLLRSVAVEPAYRGSGVGRALVDGVFDLARRLELRSLYLLTTTAREYFQRQGFADCSRDDAPAAIRETWEFRSGCPSSSAFMRRSV